MWARKTLSARSIPYTPIIVTADARCSKLENFFLAFRCSIPSLLPLPLTVSLCHDVKIRRGREAGFSQTSLRRARSNLVSKAELYGGSSSLLTLRSMQVTKKLFLPVRPGPLINFTSFYRFCAYFAPTISSVHTRKTSCFPPFYKFT